MHAPIHVNALTVKKEQAEEFFVGIQNTLRRMTRLQLRQLYFLCDQLRAVAISYSGSYQPFLGFTAGLNPEEDREYLPEHIWLLDQIGNFLDELNLNIPGGRVFINSAKAVKRMDDNSLIDLCVFQWQGEDVWRKCRQLVREARRQQGIDLT